MARTELTVQSIIKTGLTPSYSQPANTDGIKFDNDGVRVFFAVLNSTSTISTITIQTPQTADGLALSERTVTVGAAVEKWIGPFAVATYNQSDGMVYVDLSATTTHTIAVAKVPA